MSETCAGRGTWSWEGAYSAYGLGVEKARLQKTYRRNKAVHRTHPRSLSLRGLPGAVLNGRRASWKARDTSLGDEPIRACTTVREEGI